MKMGKTALFRRFRSISCVTSTVNDKCRTDSGLAAFRRAYTVQKVMGRGGFGVVYAGYRNSDRKPVAIKYVKKDKNTGWIQVDGALVPREVYCLQKLQHVEHVIELVDYYDDRENSCYVVVMDRLSRGQDLFDYITDRRRLDESEARQLMRQVVDTAVELDAEGIVHRDIKDENIIVDVETKQIRLIDFGSAAPVRRRPFTDFDGTRVYCCPEYLVAGRYTAESCTVWSLGLLLYDMLCGDFPFSDTSKALDQSPVYPQHLSPEARSLIKRCLSVDPRHRPSLREVSADRWLLTDSSSPAAAAASARTLDVSPSFSSSSSMHSDVVSLLDMSRVISLADISPVSLTTDDHVDQTEPTDLDSGVFSDFPFPTSPSADL